jgi:hypothetical protein
MNKDACFTQAGFSIILSRTLELISTLHKKRDQSKLIIILPIQSTHHIPARGSSLLVFYPTHPHPLAVIKLREFHLTEICGMICISSIYEAPNISTVSTKIFSITLSGRSLIFLNRMQLFPTSRFPNSDLYFSTRLVSIYKLM